MSLLPNHTAYVSEEQAMRKEIALSRSPKKQPVKLVHTVHLNPATD